MQRFKTIREWVRNADAAAIARARIIGTLMGALVFGVFLYHHVFFVPAQESDMAAVALVPSAGLSGVVSRGEGDSISPQQPTEDVATEVPEVLETVETAPAGGDRSALIGPDEHFSARAIAITDETGARSLYEKNSDAELPIASLTKLMTAVIVLEHMSLDDVIAVSAAAVVTDGVAGNVRAGETIVARDLLKIMLIVSSNDAAAAFADVFAGRGMDLVALMNEKAAELGMAHTHFVNPHGLDEDGHVSTASDLARLTAYSFTHRTIWDILAEKSDTVFSADARITHQLLSNNELVQAGNALILGGKTGYTTMALGCMITKLISGEIIVVLGSADRAEETERLIHTMHD
ncbi:MAG: serine hydrolase [Patescibacteria group bacterium]